MCSRCHDERAPAGSRKGRFRVDDITSFAAAGALRRIQQDINSPTVMPPKRVAILDRNAIAKLAALIEQHVR